MRGSKLGSKTQRRLAFARVLLELGDVRDAEREVAEVLDGAPDDIDALSVFAKIKHMRGELSQAIACWAQLHTHAPASHSALLQLRSMLHLAMDPERGAGDYLALGALQMLRKPSAQLEIEEAFGLYLARKPEEARSRCASLAARNKKDNPEVYKLAVLAQAWIAELSGEPELACEILEALGEERGFATDSDRVRALVPLYQRIGTPDKLEAAVHICNYLLRHKQEDIAVLATLGALHRRLGHDEEAARFERDYLAAFRRSMNRPTLAEAIGAAADRYLPLSRLVEAKLANGQSDGVTRRRERAIACAISGEHEVAHKLFARGRTLLDSMYEADCALLAGREEEAIGGYVHVVEEDPDNPDVVSWLLERDALAPNVRIRELFRRPSVAEVVSARLQAAVERGPTSAARWHRMARFWATQPGGEDAAAGYRLRAEAQARAEARSAQPIGRALAAAVYYFVGKQKGIIHEVWAGREPAGPHTGGLLPPERVFGNISSELRSSIQNVFLSVREHARTKLPHLTEDVLDFNYTYKVTKEDEPTHGSSAHLSTAIAFLSAFLQRPVPQDLAFSGALVTDAHDVLSIRAVGDTEHKVKAAVNRNLRRIILPAENRGELAANPMIPKAILDETVWFASDFDDVVRLVFGEDVFAARAAPLRRETDVVASQSQP